MQLTLVSHYGKKPPDFTRLIADLQQSLAEKLGAGFLPYAIEQVHGTIVGLEGARAGEAGIRSENFLRFRQEQRFIDFGALLAFLRSTAFPEFTVQIGGFVLEQEYGFTSQGQHPFVRSFSIQKESAVAMGWPRTGTNDFTGLDQLRCSLQTHGVLHKWHRGMEDVDNDFFFVLGRFNANIPSEIQRAAEEAVRQLMSSRQHYMLPLTKDSLSFVAYADPRLPPGESVVLPVKDERVSPALLASFYD